MRHVCIIAEAGVNHNGSYELAKKMVDIAKSAGADYVKFQTFNPEKLVSRFAEKAEYQKQNTDSDESQRDMLEKLSLTDDEFINLKKYCNKVGIGFMSTPFDLDSIAFLDRLDMDYWKIPSGEVTNLPYLKAIGKTKKRVILSSGMCNIQEIKEAKEVLEKNGTPEIIVLHCNTQYPTPYDQVNLLAMNVIRDVLHTEVGYSDHTQGIEVPIAAVAMGATVIEKHFTLDKTMEGPDHKASLDPDELKQMVFAIRNIEKALGISEKIVTKSESENRLVVRKSIVAAKKIRKGEVFSSDNLAIKRPGTGISPMRWQELLGLSSPRDFEEDELIEL